MISIPSIIIIIIIILIIMRIIIIIICSYCGLMEHEERAAAVQRPINTRHTLDRALKYVCSAKYKIYIDSSNLQFIQVYNSSV